MKNESFQIGALVLAALLTFWGSSMITDAAIRLQSKSAAGSNATRTLEAFELVDKALAPAEPTSFFSYTGSFESPFQRPVRRTARRAVRVATPRVKVKLALKGVLMKDSPLAIISDEHGKTFICKQGDVVHDQKILTIHEDQVEMRFGSARYTLEVPER
jgi:hypothetical protein